MTHVPVCDAAMASVEVSRVVQLRAVLWSIQHLIEKSRRERYLPRTMLFELQALAEVGVSVADRALDEAVD